MFGTLKMLAYKFNERKEHLKQDLKRFFYKHGYVREENKTVFSFSSKYHLECSKCGKRSLIEP